MSDTRAGVEPQPIPAEIKRWNWGAFLLNWIWGVGNNTYIALLTFIPVVGLIMPFVLGAKGSGWAWRNGRWDSVEHFKRVQRRWAIWGAVVWIAGFALIGAIFGGIFYSLKNSDAYALGVAKVQASPIAVSILGTPISAGFPFGKIALEGAAGSASLSFSVSGSKAAGTVLLEAAKKNGVWSVKRLDLNVNGHDGVINLVNGSGNDTT